jgi:4-amino-4-deoxy-L-arabinose transferase-like glycosyltransferase
VKIARKDLATKLILALIVVISGAATLLASRRMSTTFDEIVLMAGGARGYQLGAWDLAPEHPPLMQYIYGLPIHLSHPNLPPERPIPKQYSAYRYNYSQELFWLLGNNPERLALLGRMMAALCAIGLVLVTYAFTRRAGERVALTAAALVAFLPDLLGHGGVAYNDVPLALAYFGALWALDHAMRQPSVSSGLIAGLLSGIAFAVKFSAGALLPAGVLLLAAEAVSRRDERDWWKRIGVAAGATILAGYLTLVIIYRFDFSLAEMRYGIEFTQRHVMSGHGVPMYLGGRFSTQGMWDFYPVAFLYKTPVALHLLIVLAIAGGILRRRGDWKTLLASPMRMPAIGAIVFIAFLLSAKLTIGFRYALPALPLLMVLIAVGANKIADRYGPRARAVIAGLVLWYAVSSLSWFPNYLAFTSEYLRSRDRGDAVLLDSSLDWGQGLLQLRDFMRAHNIPRVYLAYMGSAMPGGYGIRYSPLRSFFPLPEQKPFGWEKDPVYAVVSATMLRGMYLNGDPYAGLRNAPLCSETVQKGCLYGIVGHTMFVYRLNE